MMMYVVGGVVVVSALWLVGLAVAIFVAPSRAERFLTGFASSARAHYTEQVLRLIAGGAMIVFSPEMRFPEPFLIFGWLLTVTSACLLLVPWKWHQRFGEWAIPLAVRYMKLYGVGAFALGGLIIYGVS